MIRVISSRWYSNLSYKHYIGKTPLKYVSVGKQLESTALQFPERDAIVSVSDNRRITFNDLLLQADSFAAGLQQIGIKYGDCVGIWAPNILEWSIVSFACARAGFIGVAMNPNYTGQEIEYCINKVGLKTIVCPENCNKIQFYDVLGSIIKHLPDQNPKSLCNLNTPSLKSIITISEKSLGGTINYKEVIDMARQESIEQIQTNQHLVKPDSPVNIQFTSGTTGKPKAAVLSHFNIVNNSLGVGKRNELDRKHHKICVQVPLFHTFGYTITLNAAANYGATMVLPSPMYNSRLNLKAIKDEKCTIIHGTPTMYVDLVNLQMQHNEEIHPEIAISGGSPCSPELFKRMRKYLNVKKVKSVYGLTETTAVAFQSNVSEDEEKSYSTVGHVSDHLEVKVVDKHDNVVPLETPGELCVRGYSNMLYYWEDKKKTEEIVDDHRWLKTGDQFVLYADGYGKIVGRLKDMIIRGGENIFPKEVEDFLNMHPDIVETHVIGLSHERLGEEVCACVKVRDGVELTLKIIKEYCDGRLAKFKIPSQLMVLDKFPKTTSGKIQKYLLKEQCEKIRSGQS